MSLLRRFTDRVLSDADRELQELARGLAPGTSRSGTICPFCRGGRSMERSFSVSRLADSTVVYICHRASCNRRGKLDVQGARSVVGPNPAPPTASSPPREVYTGVPQDMGRFWEARLLRLYGLSKEDWGRFGWCEDTETNSLVIPIYDSRQIRIGTEVRTVPGLGRGPKSRTYTITGHATNIFCLERPRARESGSIVVVEDSISALKVARQNDACALLGTNLNFEKLDEILKVSTNIILALDRDATTKSFKYAKEFGLYGNFKIAVLEKDLKYESDERIKQIIEEAK